MLSRVVFTVTLAAVLNEIFCDDYVEKAFNDRSNTFRSYVKARKKRQEDERWSWGYVDLPASTTLETTEEPTTTVTYPPYHPCSPLIVEPPEFRAQSQRISQEKCLEHIWNAKRRVEISDRNSQCYHRKFAEKHPDAILSLEIGGRDTYDGEFPHMGAIGWLTSEGTYAFKCGASLISSKFVLTAAHCTKVSDRDTSISDPVPKIIRLGDKNIQKNKYNYQSYQLTDVNILRMIVHPSYNPPKKYYDIALMELENEVKMSTRIQPACLWPNYDTSELGTKATATGWGVTEVVSKTVTPELQAVDLDLVDSRTCDNLLRGSCNRLWCGVEESQVCAGKLAGGADSCQGDSGGPLQVKINVTEWVDGAVYYIIGVTSFGLGCARANTPGIYTRVSSFIDWIEDIVWN